MNRNACFCRSLLAHARELAKKKHIPLPKHLIAYRYDRAGGSANAWFVVEGDNGFKAEITADNAYEAKFRVISAIIEQEEGISRLWTATKATGETP